MTKWQIYINTGSLKGNNTNHARRNIGVTFRDYGKVRIKDNELNLNRKKNLMCG